MKSETLQDSGADLAQFVRRHPWLTAIVGFIAVCAIVFFCLEWRSEQRWQRYAAEARARGVKLMLTDFARPEIPDEQNFAALPMMRKTIATQGKIPFFKLPPAPSTGPGTNIYSTPLDLPPSLGDPFKAKRIDWVEWQTYFQSLHWLKETSDDAPADVLRALEHYAPEIQQWREWKTRSQSRFPLDLAKATDMPLPHLGVLQSAAKVFALRMRAHLARGDAAAAYEDFRDAFQAFNSLKDEPTLICGLVRISILAVIVNAVGDGLRDHAWTETELSKIEAKLAEIRTWEDYRLAVASERGFLNATMETIMTASIQQRAQMLGRYRAFTRSNPTQDWIFTLLPRFVIRENQLRANHYFDEISARIAAGGGSLNLDLPTPSSADHLSTELEKSFYFLFSISSPVYQTVEQRYIRLQTLLDEARLACALERFRLSHGGYPATLLEMTPELIDAIPTDIYARVPYRYQRLDNGSFRLYSVGQNRRDDGGSFVPNVPEQNQLDAVWPYAPAPVAP